MIGNVHIAFGIKQLFVKILLSALRGLILVKRHAGTVVRPVVRPLSSIGRFLVCAVGVPAYRLMFFVQRHLSRVILPAKHRALYLVSNKYAVHAAVIAIAAIASSANLSETQVRAETFGSQSMLYALVAQDDTASVQVVSAASFEEGSFDSPSSYMDDSAIDASAHVDMVFDGEEYATTAVGGSVASPTLASGSSSVAPRDRAETYTIEEGDTLGSIADQYGLNLSSVLWANNLTFRSTIRPGQNIVIPPVDGVIYKVKNGDTLSKIARTYGTDTDKIIAFNKLASADDLRIGDELVVPGGEPPAPVVRRTAPVTSLFTAPTGTGSVSGSWLWPTDGRVITQKYGWRHTGLDIDGDYSTRSYAAADGVVIYSGWRNGYGNTVEVDHGNGVVTRYAHHSKNLVSVGDTVAKGQALANTGSTGRSTGTHLHFEVIVNGKFQNPLNYVR